MKKITESFIKEISLEAKCSPRKRANYNFHESYKDPINRMINAVEPEAYFPPHKHQDPPKREVFMILKGRVLVVEFSDTGDVKDHVILDPEKGNFGIEIPPGVWHSLVPLEESSVLYELKDGPYDQASDKVFAPWAPKENEEGAKEFVSKTIKACTL